MARRVLISNVHVGPLYGVGAAVLFGLSPPLAKLLLPDIMPVMMVGLLYFGAGLGLLAFEVFVYRWLGRARVETPIQPGDWPWLLGMIVFGGMLGPLLMLTGLSRLSAVLTSLLLNLEAPFTVLIAIAFFREHLSRWEGLGALLIIIGGIVVSYQPDALRVEWLGVVAVMGATLCWALDNNFTQRLSSLRDPIRITRIKALVAGLGMITLAFLFGQPVPTAPVTTEVLLLGVVSYGISLLLDTYALRLLGAAREAAYFAMAPFIGALAAVPILGERWGIQDVLTAGFMAVGLALLLTARHSHTHTHEETEHEHLHRHEVHHLHEHDSAEDSHAHPHRHHPVIHTHAHVSELHHRHPH